MDFAVHGGHDVTPAARCFSMFTGLIEHVGTVTDRAGSTCGCRLRIDAGGLLDGMSVGDSIAVDGVCLTALDLRDGTFAADVSPETLERSSLGDTGAGAAVNLERPLAVGARLGGHFVQGHVDGVTDELGRYDEGEFLRVTYALPARLRGYVVEKGSVALNGVSLTVASLQAETFDVQLVPHTLCATNLIAPTRTGRLNMEVDILGKYVARLLGERFGHVPGGEADGKAGS